MMCSLLTLDVQIIGLQEVAATASDRLVVASDTASSAMMQFFSWVMKSPP
jgi:hypothetical protein